MKTIYTKFCLLVVVALLSFGCKNKKKPGKADLSVTGDTPSAVTPVDPPAPPVSDPNEVSGVTIVLDSPGTGPNAERVFQELDSDPYTKAWEDTLRPIIIDAYGPNGIDWVQMQEDDRVKAVIHKSTQGEAIDRRYHERRDKAKGLGYKWGSYHLGVPGDPVAQADFYLETVGNPTDELLALDLEGLDAQRFMSLEEAQLFIGRIFEVTGKYPVVYCNHSVMKKISQLYGSEENLFSKCPLWYARFRSDITYFENNIWDTYTLWQFSCELNCDQTGECLYNVPGTAFDMDVNVFNGSTEELLVKWPDIGK